jgi:hypothetical protein
VEELEALATAGKSDVRLAHDRVEVRSGEILTLRVG